MDGQSTALQGRAPDHAQLAAHYGWVHAVARNLVRDPWGAEDVTQETLLAALAAPPREVPDDQRLRAWLGRVAFNLSRLGARQGARRRAREVRVARREALPSVTDELESAGTIQALSAAISELAEPYRSVVLMRYFDGLSTAEIAARTRSSELAVRKRLWRARNKLRAALDHDPVSGRLLAGLFSWSALLRRSPAPTLGGLAAGLALVAGATFWHGSVERAEPVLAAAPVELARAEVELVPAAEAAAPEEAEAPRGRTFSRPAPRQPRVPAPVPEPAPPVVLDEPRLLFAQGVVLDLDGEVRAGLELFDRDAPAEVVGTTDALGAFRIPASAPRLNLAARGPGWTTIAPAVVMASDEHGPVPRPIVVARCLDLGARVFDEAGRAVGAAELTLRCDEAAFALVPYPVRLESPVLRTFRCDELGRSFERDLPRGAGLRLEIRAGGFEPLELDTLDLGCEERFFLRALAALPVLAGRVLHRDGRPAAGASVDLALAATTTDELGRFRLLLRGVQPGSSLRARAPRDSAAPAVLSRFGERVAAGVGDVDVVLGEENDPVEGRLVGKDHARWQVVAYPRENPRLDPRGDEEPAAITHSASDGTFEFRLPRGTYDLYALAPDEPRFVRREALETGQGPWVVELPPAPGLEELSADVRTLDGLLLASAGVEVHLCAEGERGPRRMTWRELACDRRGGFLIARDPSTRLALTVTHGAVGRQDVGVSARAGHQQIVVPRSSFLQVSGAGLRAARAAVLDAEGRPLAVRGPLRRSERFALRQGHSPVLEVPGAARWLELEGEGAPPVRIPIEPRPGEVLLVRP
jgi:RNA polymerase sigma-70 factor (ECF subfamily)